jgi:predicted acyl esterase
MMNRALLRNTILAVAGTVSACSPAAFAAAQAGPGYNIEMSRMIPMRDGVQLEAWLFKPENLQGKAPAIFTLRQYDMAVGFL